MGVVDLGVNLSILLKISTTWTREEGREWEDRQEAEWCGGEERFDRQQQSDRSSPEPRD